MKPTNRFASTIPESIQWTLDNLYVYQEDFDIDPEEVEYFFDLLFLVRTFLTTINRLPKDAGEFWGREAGIARNSYLN